MIVFASVCVCVTYSLLYSFAKHSINIALTCAKHLTCRGDESTRECCRAELAPASTSACGLRLRRRGTDRDCDCQLSSNSSSSFHTAPTEADSAAAAPAAAFGGVGPKQNKKKK